MRVPAEHDSDRTSLGQQVPQRNPSVRPAIGGHGGGRVRARVAVRSDRVLVRFFGGILIFIFIFAPVATGAAGVRLAAALASYDRRGLYTMERRRTE